MDQDKAREKLKEQAQAIGGDEYRYGFHDEPAETTYQADHGLNQEAVREISRLKKEPEWMLDFRLAALEQFNKLPMPRFLDNPALDDIHFDDITYFLKAAHGGETRWEDVPEAIKRTFDRLGVPEAERKFLAGVTAQYDSEVVYHSVRENLEKQGVLFMDMDSGLREHPGLVREYFSTVVPAADNKFAALNSAAWSGGSFVYVPRGVQVDIPLQAYFRINAKKMGQFERTLIIVDEGASVHYMEGCTAPTYSEASLHAAVVEIIAKPGSRLRYTTIQNWSRNVFNLVTKRAFAYENARVEWVDGNLGSRLTAKYPAIYLLGEGASGDVISIALAGKGQHQDAGSRIIAAKSNTSATVRSKSISKQGGRASYRGTVKVMPGVKNVRINTVCDALLLDAQSRSDTYPSMRVGSKDVSVGHEATVSRIGAEQLFYLTARGLSAEEARLMIVNGFFEPFTKELPMEYAVELNRLMQMEMEGSVG